MTTEECKALYLDWINNYLTRERMAEDYQMDLITLCLALRKGRLAHDGFNIE